MPKDMVRHQKHIPMFIDSEVMAKGQIAEYFVGHFEFNIFHSIYSAIIYF